MARNIPVAQDRSALAFKSRYKRPFDLSFLIVSHILLSPLLMVLWTVVPILVWLEDRGSVFYTQKRKGKNGRVFTLMKFRTMVSGADHQGPRWTTERDRRVTRIGKILRRTALDELPEMISVWKGDMSLVGPRPLDEREHSLLEKKIAGFEERLLVPPGLTGLAQVYDQEDLAEAKLNYDLDYIQRMNPFLDLKLLMLSVRNTLLARWDRRGGKKNMTHDD